MQKASVKSHPAIFASLCLILLLSNLMSSCSSRKDSMGESDTDSQNTNTNPPLGNVDSLNPGTTSSILNDQPPRIESSAEYGDYYADANGNALYIRYTDFPGAISCTGSCAQNWQPLLTSETDQGIHGNLDVAFLVDGTAQWTLLNYPLYLFRSEAGPGLVGGDGFDNKWALARTVPANSADVNGAEALVARGTTSNAANSTSRVSRSGHTLYFFENDALGVSNCNTSCADNWPPLYADPGAQSDSNFTLITRSDGTKQWAYGGQALYFWLGDSAPGEFAGDSIALWNIARP